VLVFGIWGVISTAASQRLTPWEVQVFSVVGMVPVAIAACFTKDFSVATNLPRGWAWAFATGACNAIANVALFAALHAGVDASVIVPQTGMYPIVTVLAARVFLGERLTISQQFGVGLSLVAILLFGIATETDPPSESEKKPVDATLWMSLAMVCLLGWGISGITQKLATRYISNGMSILGFLTANIPITLMVALMFPLHWDVGWLAWGLCFAIGLCLGLGSLLLFASFSAGGQAGIVTALAALYPAITVAFAVPLFGERITSVKGLGIMLALVAGVLLSREQHPEPKESEV
jgi:transporter family protein